MKIFKLIYCPCTYPVLKHPVLNKHHCSKFKTSRDRAIQIMPTYAECISRLLEVFLLLLQTISSLALPFFNTSPYTSHQLKPPDRRCYGPFNLYCNAACDTWTIQNPGQSISIDDNSESVGATFLSALTPTDITSRFRVFGIQPSNCNVLGDEEFLAADVTDRPKPSNVPK